MGRRIACGALAVTWLAVLIIAYPLVASAGEEGVRAAPAVDMGRTTPLEPVSALGGHAGAPPPAAAAPLRPVRSLKTAAPAPAPASKPARRGRELTIAWAGDITPGSRYGLPPDEGRAQFGAVRAAVGAADLAIGNLEGTYSQGGASKCGTDGGNCFSFQAPAENAGAPAWAGFDLMNLANNHAFDFGPGGQGQTLAALERAGLAHTGRPAQITLLRRGATRIAVVGFAPYRWASDLRDLEGVRALVRTAAARADIVVALAHIGGEGSGQSHVPAGREIAMGEDRGDTRAFAHAAVEAGADLVLGSGPHVLRGMELHRGKLIAYSLGNFAGWRNFSSAGAMGLSGLLTVRLSRRGELRGGRLLPLRLEGPGVPVPDPQAQATALVNQLSADDFAGAGMRLQADGRF